MRYAIGGVILLGVLAVLYVLFQAMDTRPPVERSLIKGSVEKFIIRKAPTAMPANRFKDGAGAELSFADFKGKVLLVNLWATWCAPCKVEMPTLDRLQAELGSERFEVVAISVDRDGVDAVKPFFEQTGLDALEIYSDPTGRMGTALGAFGLPISILVDARGLDRGRILGEADWSTPEAKALIQHFIDGG